MIGDPVVGGISHGQRKLVSIGVELAANPSILFLDEPTTGTKLFRLKINDGSGLDSRAALQVVRAIRSVAVSGRSVICTIHQVRSSFLLSASSLEYQPSAELFRSFDDLLLLQTGGHQVYLGPVGYEGADLVGYFEVSQPHEQQLRYKYSNVCFSKSRVCQRCQRG